MNVIQGITSAIDVSDAFALALGVSLGWVMSCNRTIAFMAFRYAEKSRVIAEAARITAESSRVRAEDRREENEDQREENEEKREVQEEKREIAEDERS